MQMLSWQQRWRRWKSWRWSSSRMACLQLGRQLLQLPLQLLAAVLLLLLAPLWPSPPPQLPRIRRKLLPHPPAPLASRSP